MWWSCIAVLLLLLLGVGWYVRSISCPHTSVLENVKRISPKQGERSNDQGSTQKEASKERTISPTPNFLVGDQLVYDFTQEHVITMAVAPQDGLAVDTNTPSVISSTAKQEGRFVVNVYTETEEGWLVGFQLLDARFDRTGPQFRGSEDYSALSKVMALESLASISRSGRITKWLADKAASPEARNQWRDILPRWQVILPNNAKETRWARTEADGTGTYLAIYNRVESGTPYKVTKTKDHYLSVTTTDKESVSTHNSVRGKSAITMAPYQRTIYGEETLDLKEMGIRLSITMCSTFSFHLSSAHQEQSIVSAARQRTSDFALAPEELTWAGEAIPDEEGGNTSSSGRKKLKAVTRKMVEEELDALKSLLSSGKVGTVEHVHVMENLHEMIKADSASVDLILDGLTDDATATDYASTLIGILAAAGTPVAQQALLAILTTPDWPEGQKEMALTAFAQVTEPIQELDAWLTSIHKEGGALSTEALLILAATGNKVRETNPARFETVSAYVLNCADSPGLEGNNLMVGLSAIGNLGPTEVPQSVQTSFKSQDSTIRQNAVESLQRISTDTASSMIRQAALSDSDEGVRTAAIKLLADTSRAGSFDVLSKILASDQIADVRKVSVMSLDAWYDANNEVAGILKQAVIHDTSEEVRILAQQVLESHAQSQPQSGDPKTE